MSASSFVKTSRPNGGATAATWPQGRMKLERLDRFHASAISLATSSAHSSIWSSIAPWRSTTNSSIISGSCREGTWAILQGIASARRSLAVSACAKRRLFLTAARVVSMSLATANDRHHFSHPRVRQIALPPLAQSPKAHPERRIQDAAPLARQLHRTPSYSGADRSSFPGRPTLRTRGPRTRPWCCGPIGFAAALRGQLAQARQGNFALLV